MTTFDYFRQLFIFSDKLPTNYIQQIALTPRIQNHIFLLERVERKVRQEFTFLFYI